MAIDDEERREVVETQEVFNIEDEDDDDVSTHFFFTNPSPLPCSFLDSSVASSSHS